jgi:hypothetical protein
MAELPIPTRLPEVPSDSMPKLSSSHNPLVPGSGWHVYREDVMTGLLRAGLAGFLGEFYGEATETEAHDDSAVPGLLKYDGVPPAKEGITAGATAFNAQRQACTRRLQALTLSVMKQTLTAEQRISCSPPGVADAHDVDALWQRIELCVKGADSDNLAENIHDAIQAWTWPSLDVHGSPVAPLSVAALTAAVSQQAEFVARMAHVADDDYSWSVRQAIRAVVSRSPGELTPFRRAHRECATLLALQTRMAADMADVRDAPPTGINALLAAAADHQHPDNARVLAVFRTLLAPDGIGGRGGRERDGGATRTRRMDKAAGPPNVGDTYCKVHGWCRHGDGDCRAQK